MQVSAVQCPGSQRRPVPWPITCRPRGFCAEPWCSPPSPPSWVNWCSAVSTQIFRGPFWYEEYGGKLFLWYVHSDPHTDDCYLSVSQGGIAFVAIKGAFKVYFKQQQYLRQAHRKILNFPELDEAWAHHRFHPPSFWFHAALRDTTASPHYWTLSQTLDLVFFSLWMWLFCLEFEQRFIFISVDIIRPGSRALHIL